MTPSGALVILTGSYYHVRRYSTKVGWNRVPLRGDAFPSRACLDRLTLDMFQRLLTIGFVPVLLIAVVAPDLFAIIFGERWWTAGVYVRWLSLWMLFVFISSPISTIYTVLERQREYLIVNIIMFSTRLLALILGGIKGNAVQITGVVSCLLNDIINHQ